MPRWVFIYQTVAAAQEYFDAEGLPLLAVPTEFAGRITALSKDGEPLAGIEMRYAITKIQDQEQEQWHRRHPNCFRSLIKSGLGYGLTLPELIRAWGHHTGCQQNIWEIHGVILTICCLDL